MLTFALAVFFLIITPGPGVLSTAGIGSGFGFGPGLRYVAGLCAGTNLVALAVVTGFAALFMSIGWVRLALLGVSTAYLLYLAAKIAFAGSSIAFIHSQRPPGFAGGLALQAANPKAYVVNTALMTGFPFLPSSLAWELALKFAIMNAIWVPIHLLWLYAGTVLYRLDLSPRAHFAINVAMALAMIAVVALAAWSTLCRATPAS
ncbi:MAG: LysE family transporter [Nitratireductor sp.]|nr:LysE family transporter [Nitratireductor sp.]